MRASGPAARTASATSSICSRCAAAQLVVREEAGVHDDAGLRLDLRPGSGSATGRRRFPGARQSRRAAPVGDGSRGQLAAVRAVVGEAVAALGGADDRAARLDDLGRSRHALHRLVEVLVEREAGVRRDHDVEAARRPGASPSPGDRASSAVHREQLATEGVRDLLLAVQHHVEREVDAGRGGDRAHVVVDRVAFEDAPRARSGGRCAPRRAATSVVSSPASPGATIFGPPEKPAKKCGSTKPVVIRTSAATQSLLSQTGTAAPSRPIQVSEPSSRASWLTTRTESTTSAPNMRRSSSSVLPRWVPVATSTTTSSSRTSRSSSSRIAGITIVRGCGRVPSQALIATVCPARTSSRSGGPATGARSAARTASRESGAAGGYAGATTVVRPSGSSTARPSDPYASSTLRARKWRR